MVIVTIIVLCMYGNKYSIHQQTPTTTFQYFLPTEMEPNLMSVSSFSSSNSLSLLDLFRIGNILSVLIWTIFQCEGDSLLFSSYLKFDYDFVNSPSIFRALVWIVVTATTGSLPYFSNLYVQFVFWLCIAFWNSKSTTLVIRQCLQAMIFF